MPLLAPALAATCAPPVMEARRWLAGASFPPERPLINVSQAAPVDPPPLALREAMAEAALSRPEAHLYGPVLGNPELRAELATATAAHYGGTVGAEQVAITQGCNQAFCAAIATLAAPGDEVILPTPWYFNHAMWLQMNGIRAVPLPCGAGLLPDPEAAAALIGPRTRAIVLVTPNNPSGAEYPGGLVETFHALARAHDIALILDETYRDFDSRTGPPHELFRDPDWHRDVIHLYSFSKAFRLTGHRVGAMIAGTRRMAEVEKYLDCVSISASQMGQIGALWGLRNLAPWVAGEREEILSRRQRMVEGLAALDGWDVMGCGAYFAYVRHASTTPSPDLCRRLVHEAGILMLPGTMFRPDGGTDEMRIAFANIDAAGIDDLFTRLRAFAL
ncbi:aminotransferase [Falsirhodobacter algicola]|uniref:aspartate transaminase n=1 Tax=Falsirhodobacter algicola TaxID=2692330 RepID=A0A8J8MR83_9RHOB|nr:aminotransferase [Falsirhodobacter algicola]QUS35206.1 aminotransferase [Falsirhodobacter algicola]